MRDFKTEHVPDGKQALPSAILVDEWLHSLNNLNNADADELRHCDAHDLVALLGKFTRLRQEEIAAAGAESAIERGEAMLRAHPELIQRAASCISLNGWRGDLLDLDRSFDVGLELQYRSDWAIDILEEFDDAELIVARLATVDLAAYEALRAELDEAFYLLDIYRDAVLPARIYVWTMLEILDWQKVENDPLLKATRWKFDVLRAAINRFERDMGLHVNWSAVQAPVVLPFTPVEQAAPPAPRQLFQEPDRLTMAAAGQKPSPFPFRFEWKAPDQSGDKLTLLVPRTKPSSGKVRLSVSASAVSRLAHKTIIVGGVRLKLDNQAESQMDWSDLEAAQTQLEHVVVGQKVWQPQFSLDIILADFLST